MIGAKPGVAGGEPTSIFTIHPGGLMAKRAKKKAAKRTRRTRKLAVKKESVLLSGEKRDTRGAIVINSRAVRGMVIDRSAASLFKRGQ
jgi:hypothetical protein